MPSVPNLVERLLLRSGTMPGVMLDILGAATFRVAGSALRIGLFEALAEKALSVADLARKLDISPQGAERMVELLSATGYLEKNGELYGNSESTRRWLLRDSPESIVDFVRVWDGSVFDLWQGLEQSVATGKPALHFHDWLTREQGWPMFNASMRSAAKVCADEVARRTGLPAEARRLLDVGGSHALFSAAYCRRYPQLQATIFDLPEALPSARQTIEEMGLGDRVGTREGDMVADPFGEGWDALLLFNVLHYFDSSQNRQLLAKAAKSLRPGGSIVLLDQLADRAPLPTAGRFVRTLSLHYFLSLGGQVYSSSEIEGWLQAAGFSAPRCLMLRTLPGAYLLVATRTGAK